MTMTVLAQPTMFSVDADCKTFSCAGSVSRSGPGEQTDKS